MRKQIEGSTSHELLKQNVRALAWLASHLDETPRYAVWAPSSQRYRKRRKYRLCFEFWFDEFKAGRGGLASRRCIDRLNFLHSCGSSMETRLSGQLERHHSIRVADSDYAKVAYALRGHGMLPGSSREASETVVAVITGQDDLGNVWSFDSSSLVRRGTEAPTPLEVLDAAHDIRLTISLSLLADNMFVDSYRLDAAKSRGLSIVWSHRTRSAPEIAVGMIAMLKTWLGDRINFEWFVNGLEDQDEGTQRDVPRLFGILRAGLSRNIVLLANGYALEADLFSVEDTNPRVFIFWPAHAAISALALKTLMACTIKTGLIPSALAAMRRCLRILRGATDQLQGEGGARLETSSSFNLGN